MLRLPRPHAARTAAAVSQAAAACPTTTTSTTRACGICLDNLPMERLRSGLCGDACKDSFACGDWCVLFCLLVYFCYEQGPTNKPENLSALLLTRLICIVFSSLQGYFENLVTSGFDGACAPAKCPFHPTRVAVFDQWSPLVPPPILDTVKMRGGVRKDDYVPLMRAHATWLHLFFVFVFVFVIVIVIRCAGGPRPCCRSSAGPATPAKT